MFGYVPILSSLNIFTLESLTQTPAPYRITQRTATGEAYELAALAAAR